MNKKLAKGGIRFHSRDDPVFLKDTFNLLRKSFHIWDNNHIFGFVIIVLFLTNHLFLFLTILSLTCLNDQLGYPHRRSASLISSSSSFLSSSSVTTLCILFSRVRMTTNLWWIGWCELKLRYWSVEGAHFLSQIFDNFLTDSTPSTVDVRPTGEKKDRSTSFWRWIVQDTWNCQSVSLIFGFVLMNFHFIYI